MSTMSRMGMDWSHYKGQLSWLKDHTVLMVRHGSHCYGTATETSDEDFKGVAIPPPRYFHGFVDRFEQAEHHDPDLVVYDIRKFMSLAADCNPTILEVLFIDDENLLFCDDIGEELRAHREEFLSRKAVHTFTGYAISQLKRIKLHRRWLLNPVDGSKVTREAFGLPQRTLIPKDQLAAAESMIRKKLEDWHLDGLDGLDDAARIELREKVTSILTDIAVSADAQAAGRSLGFSDNFIHLLDQERRYRSAMEDLRSYEQWLKNRNPDRAAMEAAFGYDGKHGMHLLRLLLAARDLFRTGTLKVRRDDAKFLLSIRQGAMAYDDLIDCAEKLEAEIRTLAKSSPLPHDPDRAKLSRLCETLVARMHARQNI